MLARLDFFAGSLTADGQLRQEHLAGGNEETGASGWD